MKLYIKIITNLLMTFNPAKVNSKLNEHKIISLVKYNLDNKELNK